MDEARARRLNALLEEAVVLAPSERGAWIAAQADDVRADLASMLDDYESDDAFLTRSAVERLVPRPLDPGTMVGGYRILRPLGAGGGGTVYEAEQRIPRRRIALKVRPNLFGSGDSRERFLDEAGTLARLRHPDIGHVYDAGTDGDLSYFAMELVPDAESLTRHARSLGRRDTLRLFVRVCDAVAYGHAQGVVHRDLKPQNILVAPGGFPKVIDFGIATVEGLAAEGLAAGGLLAGTPPYMSPEQCAAGDVDERSDVYSLGVVLYELLTRRLPHEVDRVAPDEAMRRVREDPPAPADLPFELSAILGRALAKRADERYPSVSDLARDVRAYLARRPVSAVHGRPLYRTVRFFSRHSVVLAVLAIAATVLPLALRPAPPAPVRAPGPGDLRAYALYLAAIREQGERDPEAARRALDLVHESLRGWEWGHVYASVDLSEARLDWPGFEIVCGAVSPDGSWAAALGRAGESNSIRTWDLGSGRVARTVVLPQQAYSVAISPDSRVLSVGYFSGRLDQFGALTGEELRSWRAHAENVTAILYEPDGRWLATASKDRSIKLWSPEGRLVRTLRGHEDRVICLAIHGGLLASGGREGSVRVWDWQGNAPPRVWRDHEGVSVEGVAWSPDGRAIVSADRAGKVRLWRPGGGPERSGAHDGVARAVSFAPDGATFASASWDGTIGVWNGEGRMLTRLVGHTGKVMSVAFDGNRLYSFATDGTIRTWGRRQGVLPGHEAAVYALAFAPGGNQLVSASYDGTVRTWDVDSLAQTAMVRGPRYPVALIAGAHGTVYCLGTTEWFAWRTGHGIPHLATTAGRVADVAGGVALSAERNGVTTHAVAKDGSLVRRRHFADLHGSLVRAVAVAPDRTRVATGDAVGAIATRDAASMRPLQRLAPTGHGVRQIAFASEGRRVVVIGDDGSIRVLDAETLALVSEPADRNRERKQVFAVSPDGSRLAAGGQDGWIRIWHLETAEPLLELQAHGRVKSLAFSPRGDALAAGTTHPEKRLQIWRAAPRAR